MITSRTQADDPHAGMLDFEDFAVDQLTDGTRDGSRADYRPEWGDIRDGLGAFVNDLEHGSHTTAPNDYLRPTDGHGIKDLARVTERRAATSNNVAPSQGHAGGEPPPLRELQVEALGSTESE